MFQILLYIVLAIVLVYIVEHIRFWYFTKMGRDWRAMRKEHEEKRRKRQPGYTSEQRRNMRWENIRFIGMIIGVILLSPILIAWWLIKKPFQKTVTDDQKLQQLLSFAEYFLEGEPEVLALITEASQDLQGFIKKYRESDDMFGLDMLEVVDQAESTEDHAGALYNIIVCILCEKDKIVWVGYESDLDDLIEAFLSMDNDLLPEKPDWTFVEKLEEVGQLDEITLGSFMTLVQDEVDRRSCIMAILLDEDEQGSYVTILTGDQFDEIKKLAVDDLVSFTKYSTNPDKSYEDAKQALNL